MQIEVNTENYLLCIKLSPASTNVKWEVITWSPYLEVLPYVFERMHPSEQPVYGC